MSEKKEAWIRPVTAKEVLPLRAQVLRPHHPLMDCIFDSDLAPKAGHFGSGLEEAEILAVGTIYPESLPKNLAENLTRIMDLSSFQVWRLRGMATHPEARGQGLGAMVLQSCIGHVLKSSSSKALIWAHARTAALEFYRRHGFSTIGGQYDLPGVGPHYAIIKTDF